MILDPGSANMGAVGKERTFFMCVNLRAPAKRVCVCDICMCVCVCVCVWCVCVLCVCMYVYVL
jgi:hypothetical protein